MMLFITCFCFPLLANERSDATILTSKTVMNMQTRTHLYKTGVTIENGDVWVWGYRGMGLQGNGRKTVARRDPPARVETFIERGLSIVQLAAGRYHIIALDDQGNVWGWGRNRQFQATGAVHSRESNVSTPVEVLRNQDVVEISCSEFTSYALTRDGRVFSWGRNSHGEAGTGTRGSKSTLQQIDPRYFGNRPVVTIGSAYDSAYAINEVGEVWGWGDEQRDAFGFENKKVHIYNTIPKQITNLDGIDGKKIVHITGGNAYTAFLTSSGQVYGMGKASRLGLSGSLEDELDDDSEDGADPDEDKDNDKDNDDDDGSDDDELTEDKIKHEDEKREGAKKGKTIPTPAMITRDIKLLFCRFRGCVAVTNSDEIKTWGHKGGSLKNIMYGTRPTVRQHQGRVVKIDGGKQYLLYWNDEGKGFGVGQGSGRKFSPGSNSNRDWPGAELGWLVNKMKEVYGQDYIPGQGYSWIKQRPWSK